MIAVRDESLPRRISDIQPKMILLQLDIGMHLNGIYFSYHRVYGDANDDEGDHLFFLPSVQFIFLPCSKWNSSTAMMSSLSLRAPQESILEGGGKGGKREATATPKASPIMSIHLQ